MQKVRFTPLKAFDTYLDKMLVFRVEDVEDLSKGIDSFLPENEYR